MANPRRSRSRSPGRREAAYGGWRIPMGPAARALARPANAPSWAVWLSLALLVCALCTIAIGELGALVEGMQLPGEPAAKLSSLATNAETVKEAVSGWRRYAEAAGPELADARFVGGLRLLIDTIFVFGYVAAAGLVLLRDDLRRALSRTPEGRAATEFVLDLAFVGMVTLGLVSWIENGLTWTILRAYWDAFPGDPAGAGWAAGVATLRVLTLGKWLLVAGVAFSFAIAVLRYGLTRIRPILTSLRLVRVQLIMAVAFSAAVLAPVQIPDVILAMTPDRYWIFLALTVTFGVVSWAFSRRLVLHAHWRKSHPPPPYEEIRYRGLFMIGVAFAASASMVRLVTAMGGPPAPSLVPVALTVLIVGLGWVLGPVPQEPFKPPPLGPGGDLLPRVLGAGVVGLAGLAIVRASVGPMVYSLRWEELARVGGGTLFAVVALAMFWVLGKLDDRSEREAWRGWWRGFLLWVALIGAGPVVVLWGLVLAYPFDVPPRFGPLGVLAAFGIAATMVGGALTILAEWFSERFGVPRALRVLRFRRVPVLTLLIVWALIAGRFNDTAEHLAVRVVSGGAGPAAASNGVTLRGAFAAWVRENVAGPAPGAVGPPSGRRAVPLVLVASAGGGIRAATWTALSLDCLFEDRPILEACRIPDAPAANGEIPRRGRDAERIFLASGVSGGSLGFAEYVTQVSNTDPDRPSGPRDWVDARLGDDYLSPTFAWGLFVEGPRIFLGYDAMDRAEVLERTWELSWGGDGPDTPFGEGFLRSQSGGPRLILNGTSVRDGCTFNTSVLQLSLKEGRSVGTGEERRTVVGGCQSLDPFAEVPTQGTTPANGDAVLPGATDLLDFLCPGQDLAMSTAALLSARFPVLSPTGRIDACSTPDSARTGTAFVVDGGYVEVSGAETLMNLWPHLSELIDAHNAEASNACVVPFFVQIDNTYLRSPALSAATGSAPNEVVAPLAALRAAARAGRAARAEVAAALTFSRGFADRPSLGGRELVDRFAHLVPLAHPGVNAPLGWTLSDAAKEDLRSQLVSERNLAEIREIRSWLGGNLSCPRAG